MIRAKLSTNKSGLGWKYKSSEVLYIAAAVVVMMMSDDDDDN